MPMPSHTEALEFKFNRAISSGPILGRPNQLWWPGPQDYGRTRELVKGPDAYEIYDCDKKRVCDPRFRSLSGKDIGSSNKFGANSKDIEEGRASQVAAWTGNVTKGVPSWAAQPCRPEPFAPDRNWVLDKYGYNQRNSFTTADRSRKNSFGMSNAPRFSYPKTFGRDYSRTGVNHSQYEKWLVGYDARDPRHRPEDGPRKRSNSMPVLPGSRQSAGQR